MGATKFVRLDIPQSIFSLMQEAESLFPEQEKQESEAREFREERRPASPPSPVSPAPPNYARLADIGVTRDAWTYAVTFCGHDTFMLAARRHGGSPALACDNHAPAQAFWQRRTDRQCLASLDVFREIAKSPAGRRLLFGALVYTSAPLAQTSLVRVAAVAPIVGQAIYSSKTQRRHWRPTCLSSSARSPWAFYTKHWSIGFDKS